MPASVTYTFAPGANVESAKFNQNFTDLINYINGNVILKDASVAFTSIPTLPGTNPTTDNHAVRKAYVDGGRGVIQKREFTGVTPYAGSSQTDMGISLTSFQMPVLTGGLALRLSLFVPWCEVQDTGDPDFGQGTFEVWIRVNGTSVNVANVPIIGVFGKDEMPSVYVERWFFDNSIYTAGTSLSVDVAARIQGGGNVRLRGQAGPPVWPVQLVASLV